MSALQNFKQKGRLLRAYLAQAFSTDVALSQAYEALAAAEGTTWNVLSARLVRTGSAEKDPTEELPPVRAVFQTKDGTLQVKFDASSWFKWAGAGRIENLLYENRDTPPADFGPAYGGSGMSANGVAFVCSNSNAELKAAYETLRANRNDYRPTQCFVHMVDVQRWLRAYGALFDQDGVAKPEPTAGSQPVPDTELGKPENEARLRQVCHTAWDHAHQQWVQWRDQGTTCSYIIERSSVLAGLNESDVYPTSEEYGELEFHQSTLTLVERALCDFGYESRTLMLLHEELSLDEPFLGLAVFNDLSIGDWFRGVSTGCLYQKTGLDSARRYLRLDGTTPGETWSIAYDAWVQVVRRRELPQLAKEELGLKEEAPGQMKLERSHQGVIRSDNTLTTVAFGSVMEVHLSTHLSHCTEEGTALAKAWIEQNHTFAHRPDAGNGTWAYMLSVEKFGTIASPHKVPPQLLPQFGRAVQYGAQWIIFYL